MMLGCEPGALKSKVIAMLQIGHETLGLDQASPASLVGSAN